MDARAHTHTHRELHVKEINITTLISISTISPPFTSGTKKVKMWDALAEIVEHSLFSIFFFSLTHTHTQLIMFPLQIYFQLWFLFFPPNRALNRSYAGIEMTTSTSRCSGSDSSTSTELTVASLYNQLKEKTTYYAKILMIIRDDWWSPSIRNYF